MRLLPGLLRRIVRKGRLILIGPDGSKHLTGPGGLPEVTIRILDSKLDWQIPLNPEVRAAEAYMDGTLVVEDGTIHDLMVLIFGNKRQFDMQSGQILWNGVARRLRRAMQHNPVARARAN